MRLNSVSAPAALPVFKYVTQLLSEGTYVWFPTRLINTLRQSVSFVDMVHRVLTFMLSLGAIHLNSLIYLFSNSVFFTRHFFALPLCFLKVDGLSLVHGHKVDGVS